MNDFFYYLNCHNFYFIFDDCMMNIEYLIFNIIKFFLTTIIIYLSNQCILDCDLIIKMKFKGQYDSWSLSKKNCWTNKQKTNDELITKKIIRNFNDWLISVFYERKRDFKKRKYSSMFRQINSNEKNGLNEMIYLIFIFILLI